MENLKYFPFVSFILRRKLVANRAQTNSTRQPVRHWVLRRSVLPWQYHLGLWINPTWNLWIPNTVTSTFRGANLGVARQIAQTTHGCGWTLTPVFRWVECYYKFIYLRSSSKHELGDSSSLYIGMFLEVNQHSVLDGSIEWRHPRTQFMWGQVDKRPAKQLNDGWRFQIE